MQLRELTMVQRYEQVRLYSTSEFERRWALTRGILAAHQCDALVAFSPMSEGYDQWLADTRGLDCVALTHTGVIGARRRGVFEPAEEAPTHGGIRLLADILPVLKTLRGGRVAVVNPSAVTAGQAEALGNALLVDVTLELSVARAVKSQEEILAIASANRIHERGMLAMPAIIRPGRTFRDVSNSIVDTMCSMGSGNGLLHAFLISVGRQDEPADMRPFFPAPSRTLDYGDRLFVLLETNGLGGHCTAIGRFFSIGEPSQGFADTVNMCIQAQDYASSRMKPGVTLADIVRETRTFIEGSGWETNDQCFMHGMGYHMYEQMAVNDITENVPLQKNMFIHAHPIIKRRYPGHADPEPLHNLNAYFVSEEGGIRTNNVPNQLFVVD